QILANELDANWKDVQVVQAQGDAKYGNQNTDGSRSVRLNFDRLRLAGATMRSMLEQAAARRWKVPTRDCTAELGVVHHKASARQLGYGELAVEANKLPAPPASRVKLRERKLWRYLSQDIASLTTPRIVKGEGIFGQDLQRPGMLYAVIARPPQVLGRSKRVDKAATLKSPGVKHVVELPYVEEPVGFKPLGGVAVVAKDTWSAIRGREALQVEWDAGPNSDYDSNSFEELLIKAVRKPGKVARRRGDVQKALASSAKRVEAEYYVPHLAHSAMEPPAAVAEWEGDHVTCWGCGQTPQKARQTVAQVCGVPLENVTIHVTWLGGGFGRKSKPDFFAEAALIARRVKAPVKVVWTREDDLQHAYYHTVSAQRLEAGLDASGKCVALLHRTAFPPIGSTFVAGAKEADAGELRLGASDTPFDVANLQLESGQAAAHVRIGWLRSVANIYHAFAVQSFAAELAHAAGRDPKDYLLELIGPPRTIDPNEEGASYDNYGSPLKDYPIDTRRLRTVTEEAAKLAKWGRKLPKGHGLGIAAHRSFVSYVATVVEVAVDARGKLGIPGVWSVMDAGTMVNPNHCASQLEGGTLFGLSNALYGEITAKSGAIQQANFPDWRVMRMNEAPRHMEVKLIESSAPPGGVGEPPTPPAAPALANAIFAATGLRIRRLPIFGTDRSDRLQIAGAL
ncbi:MAG: xanthine dehydrogenase family protein molybdopterin-binding subunit, partial [Myxococcales bacterium]|nr:xanthine dehydrogenase family protein molybdopterin-binding subunit [Myxococcales bacterium]